jgi:hypothetical protein
MSGSGAASGTKGSANTGAAYQVAIQGAATQALTGKPSLSFWRWRHVPHAPFALDNVLHNFDQAVSFGATGVRCKAVRAGDLIHRVYAVVDLPGLTITPLALGSTPAGGFPNVMGDDYGDSTGPYIPTYEAVAGLSNPIGGNWCHYVNCAGFRVLKEVRVQIGPVKIDTIWADLFYCLEELQGQPGRRLCDQVMKHETRVQLIAWSSKAQSLYVPLPFWFTTLSGSAIALSTLSGNNVEFFIDFEDLSKMIVLSHTNISPYNAATSAEIASSSLAAAMLIEYVYLDDPERAVFQKHPLPPRLADGSQPPRPAGTPPYDQLIYYTQRQTHTASAGSTSAAISLAGFVNPIFELIWFARLTNNETANDWTNLSRCGPNQSGSSGYHATQHEHKPAFPINTQGKFDMAILDEIMGDHSAELDAVVDLVSAAGVYQIGSKVILDADIITTVSLEINGAQRVPQNTIAKYFRQVQPGQAHSVTPQNYVYCYNFGLKPEKHNPDGALNASRLTTATLTLGITTTEAGNTLGEVKFHVYGRTHNILTYRRGSAGLRFA